MINKSQDSADFVVGITLESQEQNKNKDEKILFKTNGNLSQSGCLMKSLS